MPSPLIQQIQDMVAAIRATQRARSGTLVAVTVGVPAALGQEAVATLVRDSLSGVGGTPVEVRTRTGEGALRLLSVEFER